LAEAKALPPNFGSAIRSALDSNNIFEDRNKREQRLKFAIQEELALIIRCFAGVENATVIYDTEQKGGLGREKVTTASVSVKPAGSVELDETKVSGIRHLVAGAIAGLKAESVTVADLNTGRVFRDEGETPEDGLYLRVRRAHEKDLRQKVLNALSYIPNVSVEPTVVLDRERLVRSKKIQHEPKTVPWRVSEQSSTHSRDSTAPAGRPGYASQQPNAPATLAAARGGGKEDNEETKTETVNLVSGEQVEKETVGLTPKRVSVTVGIPASYFVKVWQERNAEPGKEPKPDKTAVDTLRQEESTKIQKHVAALLPPVEGVSDPAELVTVTTFQDIKAAEIPAISTADKALAWIERYWSTLGILGVAAFGLVMLRSLLRSAPSGGAAVSLPVAPRLAPATAATAAQGPQGEQRPAAEATPNRLRRHQAAGKSLRDELSEMVQEDPDTAANILKAWITQTT
jgi:flagellar M-ring protein FliF